MYNKLKNMITSSLGSRVGGNQPLSAKDLESTLMSMLNYMHSIESVQHSSLVGLADEQTHPIAPPHSSVAYLSSGQTSRKVFTYFRDHDNQPLTYEPKNGSALLILFWNKQYWELLPIEILPMQSRSVRSTAIAGSAFDRTLKKRWKVADAKAVGDMIDGLRQEIFDLRRELAKLKAKGSADK